MCRVNKLVLRLEIRVIYIHTVQGASVTLIRSVYAVEASYNDFSGLKIFSDIPRKNYIRDVNICKIRQITDDIEALRTFFAEDFENEEDLRAEFKALKKNFAYLESLRSGTLLLFHRHRSSQRNS